MSVSDWAGSFENWRSALDELKVTYAFWPLMTGRVQ